MTEPPRSPSFDRPPVSQVSLEVHFDRLPKVRTAHFGLLWQAIGGRAAYPDTDDLFPDDIEVEKFPADTDRARINFSFSGRPPGTRTRFFNPTSRVEVQDDALAASWYGEPGSGDYPRYKSVRDHFARMLAAWTQVLAASELGELHVVQTEISYRNRLLAGRGWNEVDEIRDHVLRLDWLPTFGDLGTEDLHAYQRHVLKDDEGNPSGRLYMSVDSAREYHGTKSVDMSLTVRQPLSEDTPGGVMAAFDTGHKLIVHTFEIATTEHMHKLWGRRS